jgi:7,8-dihydro-6-hydroxymethylpterin-pyrophosphokinase
LRQVLRTIETTLGRVRSADKFASRPIDLDLAYYGAGVVVVDGKTIPDEDVLRYAHVAVPLAAVAPTWLHPITGQSLTTIAQQWAEIEMERRTWALTSTI